MPPQQPLIMGTNGRDPAVSAGRSGVRSNMTLDRELNAAEQTATRFGYAKAAGMPVESVEISKDGQSKGSYSITVYVKDKATAAAVSNKLSDPAVIESALSSVVLGPDPHPSVFVCERGQAC